MVYGHFKQISNVNNHLMMHEWADTYGLNCLIRWFMQVRRARLARQNERVLTDRTHETPSLWTVDPETISHVLSHSYNYEKPMEGRRTTARLIGKSEQRTFQLLI